MARSCTIGRLIARNGEGRIVRIKATADLLRRARAGTIGGAQKPLKGGPRAEQEQPQTRELCERPGLDLVRKRTNKPAVPAVLKPGRERDSFAR